MDQVRTEGGPLGDVLVLERGWQDGADEAAGSETVPAPTPVPEPPAPAWMDGHVLPPEEPARPLSPSQLGGDLVLAGEASPVLGEGAVAGATARDRGTALHLLLEHLPGWSVEARAGMAERLLPELAERAALLAEAEAVLNAPDLAFLFGDDSLAEVDVTAPLTDTPERRIFGRIDRLVVTEDSVLAVDFKSNRMIPDHPEGAPEGILRQLGAYRAALRTLWPAKSVEVAILWTRVPRLMRVPGDLADAAFARARLLDPAGTRPYVTADDA